MIHGFFSCLILRLGLSLRLGWERGNRRLLVVACVLVIALIVLGILLSY